MSLLVKCIDSFGIAQDFVPFGLDLGPSIISYLIGSLLFSSSRRACSRSWSRVNSEGSPFLAQKTKTRESREEWSRPHFPNSAAIRSVPASLSIFN